MTGRFFAYAFVAIGIALSTTHSHAQTGDLPRLLASSLLEDIEVRAKEKPALSPARLAEFANKQLAVKGFEFHSDPCDAASTATTMKYPAADADTVFHSYDARGTRFLARQPEDAPCGCWLGLPVRSISRNGAVLISTIGPLTVRLPEKFLFEEVHLVDSGLRKSIRSWIVPDGGPPDGISADGTKLYIQIGETALFLEIDSNGALTFVPRNTSGAITKFTDLRRFPKDPDNAYLGYRRFSKGRSSYTLKFSHVCA